MLDQLQVKTEADERYLWGEEEEEEEAEEGEGGGDKPAQGRGSVVAADFYNAGALLSLPDDELVRVLAEELLPAAVPAFADAKVVDSWVGKFPGAVSWFSPGSYTARPPLHGVSEIE